MPAGRRPGLETLGAEIVRGVDANPFPRPLPAYYIISSAEASSNLARFDGIRYGYRSPEYEDITSLYKNSRSEGFGEEVKRRIMLGTFALSSGYYDAYYKKALQVRTLITRDYSRIFAECDCILSPVAPTTAYKIGEKTGNPSPDVPGGHLHRPGQYCRNPQPVDALRGGSGRNAGRDAADRPRFFRTAPVPHRLCL